MTELSSFMQRALQSGPDVATAIHRRPPALNRHAPREATSRLSQENLMTRARVLTAIVVMGLAGMGVTAQQEAARGQGPGQAQGQGQGRGRGPAIPPTGAIRNVRGNLYIVPGQGPNTAVFVTKTGVVLVDTKLANNGEAILKQVRTVTDLPVTMIINTHSHPDHNGSNDYFPVSAEVVTHENLQKRVASDQKLSAVPNMLPDKTFKDKLSIGSGAEDRNSVV